MLKIPTQSTQNALPTLFHTLRRTRWLQQLLAQTKTHQTLQAIFDQECPLEVMGCCSVLEIKEQCLVIGVANASVATQLQYRTRELLPALRKHTLLRELKKIKVRISRESVSAAKPKKRKRGNVLSTEAASVLRQTAEEAIDPVLKEALLRFVGRDG